MLFKVLKSFESFLVINKLPDCHSVPQKNSSESIVTELLKQFPYLVEVNKEAGLLQRLDYETSGIMLVAKNKSCFDFLKEQIKTHQMEKTYSLIVDGIFAKEIAVNNYLGSRYKGSKKVSISKTPKKGFLEAQTTFSPIKILLDSNQSLLQAVTNTGRRHQIRVQAAHLGFPLTGDKLYGSQIAGKFMLHAEKIKLTCPETKKELTVKATKLWN